MNYIYKQGACNMKKRIYMLLIFLVSIFLFVDMAEASTYMWLNCYYDSNICTGECEESIDWNNFFVVNDVNGEPASLAVDIDNFSSEKNFRDTTPYVGFVNPTCWFSNIADIEEKCTSGLFGPDSDADKIDDPSNLLKSGVCPSGVRQYYNKEDDGGQDYFRVAAGTNRFLIDSSVLDNPEFVLYKFKSYPYKSSVTVTEEASKYDMYIFEVYDTNGKYGVIFNGNPEKNDHSALQVATDIYNFFRNDNRNSFYSTDVVVNNYISNKYVDYHPDRISAAGMSQIMRLYYIDDKASYYKVASEYDARIISLASNYHERDISADDITVIFSSNDTTNLKKDVIEWYENNKEVISSNNETLNNIKKMDDLIYNSTSLVDNVENNKTYTFGDYNIDDMLTDLDIAYNFLSTYTLDNNQYQTIGDSDGKIVYVDDPVVAANNIINYKYFGTPVLTEIREGEGVWGVNFVVNRAMVAKTILNVVKENMNELINSGTIELGFIDEVKDYIKLFSSTVVYLDKYSADFGFSAEQKNKINEIRTNFSDLSNYYDVYVVVDCKGLLGEDLVNKINSFLNIIKIAIPIILIGFGVLDFIKAIFANDDNKMKQAQISFIKRIGIAILIFFVPVIVNLILNVANEVWSFISPDTCGLF